jgi:two-component system sensor histidine kinase MtrB
MSADDTHGVFQRFYRGSASRSGRGLGTGLGLAVVKTLARRWSAHASITTRPDGGARAELRLPAATAPTKADTIDLTTPQVTP